MFLVFHLAGSTSRATKTFQSSLGIISRPTIIFGPFSKTPETFSVRKANVKSLKQKKNKILRFETRKTSGETLLLLQKGGTTKQFLVSFTLFVKEKNQFKANQDLVAKLPRISTEAH